MYNKIKYNKISQLNVSRFQEFANSSHLLIGVSVNTYEIRRVNVKKQVSETPDGQRTCF